MYRGAKISYKGTQKFEDVSQKNCQRMKKREGMDGWERPKQSISVPKIQISPYPFMRTTTTTLHNTNSILVLIHFGSDLIIWHFQFSNALSYNY